MTAWSGGPSEGTRASRTTSARNLGVAAAKHEHQRAQEAVVAARTTVKVAKAELMSVRAERYAGRATMRDVMNAYARYTNAKRSLRAAVAAAEARRQSIDIARLATRGAPSAQPLAQVVAAHDAVTARWLEYETDAAKLIAFPAMTDVRDPSTAVFLRQQRAAQELRPRRDARISVEEFYAYRDAVIGLQTAFTAAEQNAWRLAREEGERDRQSAARARHVEALAAAEAELQEARDAAARAAAQHPPDADEPSRRAAWPVPGWTRPAPPQG